MKKVKTQISDAIKNWCNEWGCMRYDDPEVLDLENQIADVLKENKIK